MIQELWDHNVKVGFRCKVIANQCKDIVMGSEAAAMELERRLKVDAPWVFDDDYGVESSFMRRERIVLPLRAWAFIAFCRFGEGSLDQTSGSV